MRRLILTILLSLMGMTAAYSQIKLSGRVLYADSGKPVEFANVMVRNVKMTDIYAYAITDNNGEYSIEGTFASDSLALTVTGVHIESCTKRVRNKSYIIDFSVKEKILELKEVVKTAEVPAIRRGGDTLTYIAYKYKDKNDLVVEDIIKKLPGVEVKESGKIAYQGKEISRFYIEGLDMLGSGYTVASKNINVDDVRSIEIYENHQHIKALQEIQRPDAAAMNITLKEDAKGTWTGSLAAGVGYKPWMWRGNATLMYFGKKMQSINTYKTNNMGDNVALEFGSTNNNETIIGIRFPTVPPLNERLYINNNVHAVTSNFLFKLSETLQMKLNAWYVHDYRKSEGVSQTVHNIVGEAPVVIDESILASEKSDRVNLDLKIENNKEKSYLNNTLYFNGDFSEDFGRVTSNSSPVNQSFGLPSLSTGNNLQMIIPVAGKFSLNLSSRIAYKHSPNSLKIKPLLFPDIFGEQSSDNAIQTLNSSQFITQNSLFGNYTIGRWNIALGVGVNAHIEDMKSKLYSGGHTETVDSMRNDINWQRYDIIIGPRISYKVNDIFSITASVNADLIHLQSRDKVRGQTDRITTVMANPSISLNGKITSDLKYSASASYTEYYGGLYDSYGGFIMTDYRNIASKDGKLRHVRHQNYAASMSYGNALNMIFANVDASYWSANSNLTYAYTYDGALTYIESVDVPNLSHGLGLYAKISKQFLDISTHFSISGGWNRTWSEVIRQGIRLNCMNDFYTALFGFNTRFTRWMNMDYTISYNRSESNVDAASKIAPVDYIKQAAELLFDLGKGFTLSVNCEHYYNSSTLLAEYRNMVFLGAELSYKTKRFSYSLEGRNLLNTKSYMSAFISDITDYRYSYSLRPLCIIAVVRFHF